MDAGQLYDSIHLDVTVGAGFEAAATKIRELIQRIGRINQTQAVVGVDTSQIDAAISRLSELQTRMATGGGAAAPTGAPAPPREPTGPRRPYVSPHHRYQREKDKYLAERRVAPRRAGERRTGFEVDPPRRAADAIGRIVPAAEGAAGSIKNITTATTAMKNSLKTAVPAAEAARVKLDAVKLTGGNMKLALGEAAVAQTNLKNAIVASTGKLPANSKALDTANRKLRTLNSTMDEARGKTSAYTLSWKNITNVMGKVAFWAVATGAIYGMVRAFKSMLDTITKVDHAMATIRKVYQGAPHDIQPLRNELINLNVALGGNVEQSLEAAVGWARLGYKRREIVNLMRTSMLAMNIAELSATEATTLLTAAMQQFHIGAAGAITVLDSWNELSNKTLATTRDLGDSVSIAGATFEQTGDSIHYLNAITATLVQTMAKSGREVGTAMRTIGTYMYRPRTMKRVKEVTGIEIAKAPTPERMPDEKRLEYMRRMRDNMKSQSEVLSEVAGKWGALTEAEQINIAQSMAGVRRYNYFMALMENYGLVMDNLLVSIDSVGSAERENSIYMDTLQKQSERLKNAFAKLYVAAGDGGLAGALKSIIKLLTFVVDGFAGVNFTVPLITIAVLALANGFKKLIRIGGGFRNMLRGFRSPMGQFNLSLLAVGAAFTVLESAAASAQKRLEDVKAATDDWIASMDGAAAGIKNVAENVTTLGQYKDFLELKYKPGSPEYIAGMEKYTKHIEEQAEQLMLLEGVTYDEAKAKIESGDVTKSYTAALDDEGRKLDVALAGYHETLDVLERFNADTPEAEENMSAFLVALKQTGNESANIWGAMGLQWDTIKKKGVGAFKEVEVQGHQVNKAADLIRNKIESLNDAKTTNIQAQVDALGTEMGELTESAGGAGKKIDMLQRLMDLFAESLRGVNRDIALVNHLMGFNNNILDQMEAKYGAGTYAAEGYVATLGENENYLRDLIVAQEEKIKKDYEHLDSLRASEAMLLKSGNTAKEYEDAIDDLTATVHEDEKALADLQARLIEINDRGFAAFIDLLERQRDFERAPDALSRVLPSRKDAMEFGRDISYIVDELEAIGEKTGEDILGAMERWGVHANSIYISYDQIQNILTEINATEQEREAIERRIQSLQEINIRYAEKLNQEYDHLANTFQNIVDEGLWGIITGEQTALELAKQIGEEYGKIALKTITQPATERFAAGMAGAGYFMRHGELPPAMKGGIMDVALTPEGAVPVKDIALAEAIASGQLGGAQGIGFPQGVGGAGGIQGVGGAGLMAGGAAGGGIPGWLGPMAGGAISGGLMGSGGGAGGAAFSGAMGAVGGYLGTLGPWGMLAGAGVSLLGLLGNLFGGGPKYTEEDPYARQQRQGMGERSVNIGSAGTVHNSIHLTVYYESSADAENVARLYDLMETEGVNRGYQTSGSPSPTPV